jgi:hypothetical protein
LATSFYFVQPSMGPCKPYVLTKVIAISKHC